MPTDTYHVTLAFIGDILDTTIPSIRELGATVAARRGQVSLSDCKFWPQPRVVVVTADVIAPALADFADRLQSLVAPYRASHAMEPRWRPHVTLARKVWQPPVLQAMSPIKWVAGSFSLMRSEHIGGRSVYTVVDTYPLLDEI